MAEEKTVSKVIQDKVGFKPAYELSLAEKQALDKANVDIIINKKKETVTFVIRLNEYVKFNSQRKDRKYLEPNTWTLIKLKIGKSLKEEIDNFSMPRPIRLIRGLGSDGRIYHKWQCWFYEGKYYSDFIDNEDIELINSLTESKLMNPVKWYDVQSAEIDEEVKF